MSESESDSDLDVSGYDLEDNLNAYRSPIYRLKVSEPTLTPAENRTQVYLKLFSLHSMICYKVFA